MVHALVADPIVGFELHRVAIAPTTPLVAGEVVVATVLLRVPTGHEAIDREHPAGRLRCQACTEGCTPLAFALSQHIQSPGFQWRRSFLRVLQKTHICFQRGLHWEHVLQTQALSSIRLFCLSSSSSSSSDLPDSRLSTSTLVSCLYASDSDSSQTSYFAGFVPLVGHRFCQGRSGLNLSCRHKSGRGGWETGREREVSSPAFKADVPSEHHACGTKIDSRTIRACGAAVATLQCFCSAGPPHDPGTHQIPGPRLPNPTPPRPFRPPDPRTFQTSDLRLPTEMRSRDSWTCIS